MKEQFIEWFKGLSLNDQANVIGRLLVPVEKYSPEVEAQLIRKYDGWWNPVNKK